MRVTNITVHLVLNEVLKDVYFSQVWSPVPTVGVPIVLGFNRGDERWYCDAQTVTELLQELDGVPFKWGKLQELMKARFKRDKEALFLLYTPSIELEFEDGTTKQLDTVDNWFRFDWNEECDYQLKDRLYDLFFETGGFADALADYYDYNLERIARDTWTFDLVTNN